MKSKSRPLGGYTILEVMIFMAVSLLLLVGAMVAVGGRQAQIQFTQGARDLESKLQDIINDTATGYFPHSNDFRCFVTSGGSGNITFDSSNDEQGTSEGCIFLGKAVQFSVDGNQDRLNVFSIVGKRSASILSEAQPTVVANSHGDLTESLQTQNGVRITRVARLTGGFPAFGSIAFIAKLGGSIGDSGTTTTDFAAVRNTSLNTSKSVAANAITGNLTSSVFNPPEGVIICLTDPSGSRRAAITIGTNRAGAATTLDFDTRNRSACP